jgi:hypothetical protein
MGESGRLGTTPLQTAEQRELEIISLLKLSLVQVMLKSVMIGEMKADSPIGSCDRTTPSRPLFAAVNANRNCFPLSSLVGPRPILLVGLRTTGRRDIQQSGSAIGQFGDPFGLARLLWI